jgi:Immunity protein Imm1
MFVTFMFADEWQDRVDHGTGVANPTWNQIKAAIAALDGKRKTMVSIADKQGSDHYMLVAGQWDGRCLVNATKDNVDFFSIVDSSRSSKKLMLYVGGQDGEYEERKCVPVDWALEAAEHFFQTGELKSTMSWASDY